MSSTATSAATSSEASLQQQQSKQQRKTLVSKILKRTTSLQPTSHDQKQSTSVNSTVTLNLKNNEVADSEEIGKYKKWHISFSGNFQRNPKILLSFLVGVV